MSAEYRHYFCQFCGQHQRTAIEKDPLNSADLELVWQSIAPGKFECGDWSKENMKFQGHGCGKAATIELISRGGSPVHRARSNE